MRLTTFSDYTLRVLIYLVLHPDRQSTIAEIATAYGISKNHLMKVVHFLATQGYVETTRGKGGGIRIKSPSEDIRLGDLLRQTEADSALVECFRPAGSECAIDGACMLRGVLHKAQDGFYAIMNEYSLADVTRNQDRLSALLGSGAPSGAGTG